ncbi:MAG: ABC-type dipeptide/oligopeptide/nickel transport system, permease component [halophilic archaeon J07HX64]|jgi:ABC-type dipeptide/oligopeptide/nickel transport systems, permease components|nr:MAG: ABC-type dipeptide/oligopeptide/nickel transport system, permease component [halophilic archaeon J07HX64]
MSETGSQTGGPESDVAPLRERFLDNPRPALLWFAGALVLLALELGRVLGWIKGLGTGVKFVVMTTATLPKWVGNNVESAVADTGVLPGSLEPVGELLGSGVVTVLVFIFAVSVFLSLSERRVTRLVRPDMPSYRRLTLERVLLTGGLTAVSALMVLTPVGGVVEGVIGFLTAVLDNISDQAPTLTSRETIPNQGYRSPDGSGWEGTFLGLSPGQSWGVRVAVVYAYALAWLAWLWRGYTVFRDQYRAADWTPRDDTFDRFSGHYWGLFGLVVVFSFVVLALWAPAISTVPLEERSEEPYRFEHQFLDDEDIEGIPFTDGSGEVETVRHGQANLYSVSQGGSRNVGLMSYDDFDRFSPLGTTPSGSDMMTQLAYGARTSLIIALTGLGLAMLIAFVMALLTAYYKGLLDLLTVVTSDTIISIPLFLMVMMLSVVLSGSEHPLVTPLDGGLLLALIFAFAFWPGLWRAIRGPTLQIAEEDWINAAKSYGQTPSKIMRKHMAPYVVSYAMIYASLLIGSAIIVTAALSFLGLGISEPTPEWGRLISSGRSYITTNSWHVSTVSGIMIVFVVAGFNALGDGIRDAIDPESDVGEGDAAASGGGG